MKIISLDPNNLRYHQLHERTATIGVFDGFHLGHQNLVNITAKTAAETLTIPTLITFEPSPEEYFAKAPHLRVMQLRDKVRYLQSIQKIAELVVIRFNRSFAQMSANEFIDNVLYKSLTIRHLVIGDDFRFGANAQGNYASLLEYGQHHHFTVQQLPQQQYQGQRISSTLLRTLLQQSNFMQLKILLGRDYTITGRVIKGRQLARTLGFATANIALQHRVLPLSGVYNVWLKEKNHGVVRQGIANIGYRPTVDGITPMLEVHLHDYSGDLYTKECQVGFLHKIRDECKFASIAELSAQIKQDVMQSREYFERLMKK